MRAKRDQAVRRPTATRKEVLRLSTELVALRFKTKALRTHNADPDTGEESSHGEGVSAPGVSRHSELKGIGATR
ncbi:hypothetical protein ACLOJK_022973 [Asimina triloba]